MTIDHNPSRRDQVANLQYIADLANRILGAPRAAAWLCQSRSELEGQAPIDDLDTEEGLQRVEALLLKYAGGSV